MNQTPRKSILALVALAALSSAVLVATDASARGFGGGGRSFGGGGGHLGGGFGGGLAARSLGGGFAGHGIGGNLASGNIGRAPVLAGGNAGVHLPPVSHVSPTLPAPVSGAHLPTLHPTVPGGTIQPPPGGLHLPPVASL